MEFQVGDKVKCLHPYVVIPSFKGMVGTVAEVDAMAGTIAEADSYDLSEQVLLIDYGHCTQVAYVKTDGVVLADDAEELRLCFGDVEVSFKEYILDLDPHEKTPTESTAGGYTPKDIKEPSGKIASDGGSSAYYDFPEESSTLNDLIEYKDMSFAQGNIFKAAYRLGNKEGISLEYDLKKIIYYAERMLNKLNQGETE